MAIGTPLYYAFNVAGNKGFIIISADDFVKPVLGYGTDGSFKVENAPVVITGWLDKYNKQIAYAKKNLSVATEAIAHQWLNLYGNTSGSAKSITAGGAVGPLCTTTWDQGLYYNNFCPQDAQSPNGFNGRVPTGCGATAMAQIMPTGVILRKDKQPFICKQLRNIER